MKPKYEQPENMETALDCAIREFEVNNDVLASGYQIPTNEPNYIYYNYMSNESWVSFLNKMPENFKNQFKNGGGDEIEEKKGRWGVTPPKMASFGSSSRLIYNLSKGIQGFIFEEQLDTRVGGIANLDGFLHKGNEYIYVEAKRREIYYGTHENEKIKSVYVPVYWKIQNLCSKFSFTPNDVNDENEEKTKKITFTINGEPVKYFDLKQLICHFLGITYDIAKHSVKNAKVTFLYLLYNPNEVEDKIDEKYREKVKNRYDEVESFIRDKKDVFKAIFDAVLQYQTETHKLEKPNIDFNFKLVDQDAYLNELK